MRVHTLNYAVGNGSTILIFTLTWFSLSNATKDAHHCYNLFNNSISTHNMFFLSLILEREKKTYPEKLPTKPRSKILEDHFPCNGSIFHSMDAIFVFNFELYMATSVPRLIPLTAFFFIKLLHFSNSFVNFIIYIVRFHSHRKALFSLCRFYCVL